MRLSSDPAARRRLALLVGSGLAALVAGVAVGASGNGGDEPGAAQSRTAAALEHRALEAVDRLSLRQRVGQLTISSFPDPAVPGYVRRRLGARETAGVILFGLNASGPRAWRRLTRSLQRPARGEALIMVDQEGGSVRALRWAGPVASQPQQGQPPAVRRAAARAARRLRGAGVNVNLAPVADVPAGPTPALAARSFPGNARSVAARTRSSVEGMTDGGVGATAKHFPGLGAAQVNTDDGSADVPGPRERDLLPFRAAVAAGVPLVMLSHARYPAVDRRRIASQSPAVVTGLLRRGLGFEGVIVTDSIEAQAVLDRSGIGRAAERSIAAGADLILMTGSASWNVVHARLMRRARASSAFRERVRRSAARVLALKRRLGLLG